MFTKARARRLGGWEVRMLATPAVGSPTTGKPDTDRYLTSSTGRIDRLTIAYWLMTWDSYDRSTTGTGTVVESMNINLFITLNSGTLDNSITVRIFQKGFPGISGPGSPGIMSCLRDFSIRDQFGPAGASTKMTYFRYTNRTWYDPRIALLQVVDLCVESTRRVPAGDDDELCRTSHETIYCFTHILLQTPVWWRGPQTQQQTKYD